MSADIQQSPGQGGSQDWEPRQLIKKIGRKPTWGKKFLGRGKPETYTAEQWNWVFHEVANQHVGLVSSFMEEPGFAKVRDAENNTLAHWGVRFHRGLAMKALEINRIASIRGG